MFRRKKSTADAARGQVNINISLPMQMTAQAPSSLATPLLYERFAKKATIDLDLDGKGAFKRTNTPYTRSSQHIGNDGPSTRLRSATLDGAVMTKNGYGDGYERTSSAPNVPPVPSPPQKQGLARNGLGEREGRKTRSGWTGGHIQTDDASRGAPPTATRELPDGSPRLGKKVSRENIHIHIDATTREAVTQNDFSAPMQPLPSRSLVIPSIPISSLATVTPSTPQPRSAAFSPDATNTSPSSPAADESGRLFSKGPSLGNSLESRRMQRKPKYSPLAAFGPESPTSPIPKVSAKTAHARSVTVASIKTEESIQDAVDIRSASALGGSAAGSPLVQPDSSHDIFSSDVRESLQPLKTASVELRVGLNEDEAIFYSPLFASAFGGDADSNNDKNAAVIPSGSISASSDSGREDDPYGIKAKAKNDFTARAPPTPPTPPLRPAQPTINSIARSTVEKTAPELDTAARTRRRMDSETNRGRQERVWEQKQEQQERSQSRARTISASSVGSDSRRTAYEEQMPELPAEYVQRTREWDGLYGMDMDMENPRTPRLHNEIPTPPTSVYGHSVSSRATVRVTNASAHDVERDFSHELTSADSDANIQTHRADTRREHMVSSGKRMDMNAANDNGHSPSDYSLIADVMTSNGSASSSDRFKPTINTSSLNIDHAPLSPPQSPPQPQASILKPQRPRNKLRSRSKSKARRPGTNDSAHSYVPPSSASSSDAGPQRSHSAQSLLMNPVAHKVAKSHVAETPMSELSTDVGMAVSSEMLVDADPFAKDDIVRTPSSTVNSNSSITSIPPPFAHPQGSASPSPSSPDDYISSRIRRRGERLDKRPQEVMDALARVGKSVTETEVPVSDAEIPESMQEAETEPEPEHVPEPEPTFYPLDRHLMDPSLFGALLPYLAFHEWCVLIAVNDALRRAVEHRRELREIVLEHFLNTVGYSCWPSGVKEPIMLTFRDLNSYMRAVSVPSHQYAVSAKAWLDIRHQQQQQRSENATLSMQLKSATIQKSLLASSCRAYTRVVLRLRAQAEIMEEAGINEPIYQFTPPHSSTSINAKAYAKSIRARSASRSRTASRPPSPMSTASHSAFSRSHSGHGRELSSQLQPPRFRSPLFRVGHAPCLRVFVPSAEGTWLADHSVIECENELKRAGVVPLLRAGDIVWDAAVGDEGNVGRMVWDGNYLIDLDYTFSRTGELPQYLHTLSFPPSYFHRVIRTSGNPVCYIDISPWGEEIAANLQLLQDRVKTETPQGGHHTVVRWIHRSRFSIWPNPYSNAHIPIPDSSLTVNPGWYGTIIVETEGTNEGLVDLQDRCKTGFPPRAGADKNKNKTHGRAFSLLRERSRPGEIWLRAVREKERLM